jgi:hypothetical protein
VSPQPGPAQSLADAVREAVLRVDGVAGTHTGTFGEVGTYLPGRRVEGVRLRPGGAEVHVVLEWDAPVGATADAIRAATAPLTGATVDVVIQDVAAPPDAVAGSYR